MWQATVLLASRCQSPASHTPLFLQVEVHPYHRNERLLAFCAQNNIHVTAYAPLGSPDSASIFPRKKPLVLMEDATVKASAGYVTQHAVGFWLSG